VIAALQGGQGGEVLAQGLEGPYEDRDVNTREGAGDAAAARAPAGPLLNTRGSEVALRELEPFLLGQGRGL
jgi:hypothetical protein